MKPEEREDHLRMLRFIYNHLECGVPPTEFLPCLETISAVSVFLEREGQMEEDTTYKSISPKIVGFIAGTFVEAQPTPVDLEPVQELIATIKGLDLVGLGTDAVETQKGWICRAAIDALPALRSLLAERPVLIDKAISFDLDQAGIEGRERAAVELVELRAEVERLREENARWRNLHGPV